MSKGHHTWIMLSTIQQRADFETFLMANPNAIPAIKFVERRQVVSDSGSFIAAVLVIECGNDVSKVS